MAVAAVALAAPAYAQQIVEIGRESPRRKPILDTVRAAVEGVLGVGVIFVVDRHPSVLGGRFASLHPRDAAGNRIDYRRTRIAKDFDPEQDSDLVGAFVRRRGGALTHAKSAFPPTKVYWEKWERRLRIPARDVLERIAARRSCGAAHSKNARASTTSISPRV